MNSVGLRFRLAARLAFTASAESELAGDEQRKCDGYTEREVRFQGAEGEVPALLLLPNRPSGGGVVVHHQHASQWHLGKSEVAGLDRRLNQVRDWLTPRRNVLGNRDRLNRLLMLMQLQLNDLADEARYAAHIRDWLDARGGHAAERRLLTDRAGYPSLRG